VAFFSQGLQRQVLVAEGGSKSHLQESVGGQVYSGTALQAAEKGLFSNEHCEEHTSGAKALVDSAGLYVGVKTPTYQSRPTA
jgi:hypothetical protein